MKKAVFTYGRFNPPHKGHGLVFEKLTQRARDNNADMFVVLSRSHDKNRNPLSFEQKKSFIDSIFSIQVFDEIEIRNVFEFLEWLEVTGYTDIEFVVGDDRLLLFNEMKKYALNFKSFELVLSGNRNENEKDISGVSASRVRQVVKENDVRKFQSFMPEQVNINIINEMFETLRKNNG